MRTILFIIVSFLGCIARATAWDDIHKCFDGIYHLPSFSFSFEFSMYKAAGDKTAAEAYTGEAVKEGKNYYSSFMGRSVIYNDANKDLVYINDNSKTLIYSTSVQDKKSASPQPTTKDLLQLDSAIFANATAEYIQNDASALIIEIRPKNSPAYKSIIIEISPADFMLKRVAYTMKKQDGYTFFDHMEVRYTHFTSSAAAVHKKESIFDTRRFLSIRGKEVTAEGPYKKYKLINQLKPAGK